MLLIPCNVPHSAVALEDTLDVDVFSPPRQDWLDRTDDYLRGRRYVVSGRPASSPARSARSFILRVTLWPSRSKMRTV